MSIDPQMDMRVETYRTQTRHNIAMSDPLMIIGAPPCTVFSSMQNIKTHVPSGTGSNNALVLLPMCGPSYV